MKLKTGLKLRKVGDRYMLVDVSEHDLNVTADHTFNSTAAFIWNAAADRGVDPAAIAAMICDEYDVDYATALADVNRLLDAWKESGIIVE